jgi:5-methylcytosine-specific restriction protein A
LNESQYQQAALERASEKTTAGNSEYVEQIGGKEVPPKLNGHFSGYPRDTNAAAVALKKAEFACEIDKKHQTFVSRSKDRPYVEAHHLIPMNQQGQHVKSLDVTANIVALCPMCHKLLHYGRLKDKKTHIINLFNSRERRLKDMGIEIDRRLLLGFYSKDFVEDEA